MEYLQSIGSQITLFWRSVGFGFLLGVGYDLLRFVRLMIGGRRRLAFWDVLFGAAAGLCTFIYDLIYADGTLRVFVLLAQCAGFAVWYALAAAAVRRRLDRLPRAIRRCGACLCRPLARAERFLRRKQADGGRKVRKTVKKFAEKSKKLLKFSHVLCILNK